MVIIYWETYFNKKGANDPARRSIFHQSQYLKGKKNRHFSLADSRNLSSKLWKYIYLGKLFKGNHTAKIINNISEVLLKWNNIEVYYLKSIHTYMCISTNIVHKLVVFVFNPLMPSGVFNICCPRDCVSRHNGGTSGAPLMPRDAVSRTANVERTVRH